MSPKSDDDIWTLLSMFFLDIFTVVGVDMFHLLCCTFLVTGSGCEVWTVVVDSADLVGTNVLGLLCISCGRSGRHGGRRGRNVGYIAAVRADIVGFRHGASES